jgi:RNA polymerase II elongation factor ELL
MGPVAPNGKSLKAKALRFALVHLLAVRPVSEKFICNSLKCSPQDLTPDLRKLMQPARLDSSKNELIDRAYKELDVWSFRYKTQEDRQAAIDRAIKVYDRMRISIQENVWQLLLPKEERGKGIILSKLSLHNGPLTYARTPRISVEDAEQDNNADNTVDNATGTDSDHRQGRLAPGNTESNARATSQDPIKKMKVSEREAQAKRLLAKKPTKKITSAKPKESKPVVKDTKKTSSAESNKVKSTEFVNDSDEEERMEDIVSTGASKLSNVSQTPKPSQSKTAEKRLPSFTTKGARKTIESEQKRSPIMPESTCQKSPEYAATSPKSAGSGSARGHSDASLGSTGMVRTGSHKRTTSSPMKPSPLGSSPPVFASDLDNEKAISNGSSSSLTPITASPQLSRSQNSSQLSPPGNSDAGLKRKANDIDSDIHDHSGEARTNGYHPAKRHRADDTPPISDPSDSSGGMSPDVSQATLKMARRFREMYEKYFVFHYKVVEQSNPRREDVEKLIRMKERLEELKAEIYQAVES